MNSFSGRFLEGSEAQGRGTIDDELQQQPPGDWEGGDMDPPLPQPRLPQVAPRAG